MSIDVPTLNYGCENLIMTEKMREVAVLSVDCRVAKLSRRHGVRKFVVRGGSQSRSTAPRHQIDS